MAKTRVEFTWQARVLDSNHSDLGRVTSNIADRDLITPFHRKQGIVQSAMAFAVLCVE
jgi:hypothetical protein